MLHRRRRITALAVVGALALAAAPATGATTQLDVVVMLDAEHPGARGAAQAVAAQHGVDASYVYSAALDGFAGQVTPGRLRGLQRDPRVAVVETDAEVTKVGQTVPIGVQRIHAEANTAIPTDGQGGAVDVDVAVLDTGIDASHPDLHVVSSTVCEDRRTGPPSSRGVSCSSGGSDQDGHGTHVAGTLAARDNSLGVVGVAPGARLWSVKVLGNQGTGSISTVVAGIDFVTANADEIDVANLSLAGDASAIMDEAVSRSVAAGVTYVLAAGNGEQDVSGVSPAGHPDALTVAALADFDGRPGGLGEATDCGYPYPDGDDTFASFSNFGAGVDLVAPGTCIRSTFPGGGLAMTDGTSMAAPHVAGAAAILASQGYGRAEIHATLLGTATFDWDADSAPRGHRYPLLDVGDANTFAPRMVGDEPDPTDPDPTDPDPTDPDPTDPDPTDPEEPALTLEASAVSLRGGQWEATVSLQADDGQELEPVRIVYETQRGEQDQMQLDCEPAACSGSLILPNRESSVTFTVESAGDRSADALPPPVTVSR